MSDDSASASYVGPGLTHDAVLSKLRALEVKYLRIYWHDYTSSAKCRLVPIKRVYTALEKSQRFTLSITEASLGILPNDHLVPGVTATGTYTLLPDWSSLKSGPAPGHASCYANFLGEDDSLATLCPRGILSRAVEKAAAADLTFLVGFELEFTVLQRAGAVTSEDEQWDPAPKYEMLNNDGHAWSMARALASWGADNSFGTVADEIITNLEKCGINIEQFHAEAAPGQYELVLPPLTPLEACDTLLHTRQIVESAAARRGFRVTLHPRPFGGIGNGCHAHISITSEKGDHPSVYERFYGGILEHFQAIFAFTNSHLTSYERSVDGLWAGGRWITWGTQNKETPLRKCQDSHWEVKVLDGIANPYLATAALLFAGTHGAKLRWRDCSGDPAILNEQERKALAIEKKFPADLPQALEALKEDHTMVALFGRDVIDRYVSVKHAELDILHNMNKHQIKHWVFERY
ncbi:hypothetical protein GGR50DRAFT_641113 [Xylaria sp. CBS 124048]|nr:hypothetical protein GGR50DRAFT_641113 [Xylaria sp. CBS 124048]